MFKKIAMVVLFATVFGAFTLNAAPSKAEVQKMFKTMISKKWNREFFQPAVCTSKACPGGSWKHMKDGDNSEWAVFHPTRIRETSKDLTITGYFEDEDGLEYEEDVYTFKFYKRSGKWLIGRVFYTDKGKDKDYQYNFNKGAMEVFEVEGL